jgi:hypothetical protein
MVVLNKTRKKRVPLNPEIPLPSSVKPGDNFYMHINGNWLRHARMPPYLSSYGVSEEIESIIDDELLEILYESRAIVRSNPDKIIPHTKYLLGTLTESVVNSSSQKINIKFLKSMVGSFKCIRDTFDVATTLGDFIKHRIPTSLILFVDSLVDSFILDTFLYKIHFFTPFLFSVIIQVLLSFPFFLVPTLYKVALCVGLFLSLIYILEIISTYFKKLLKTNIIYLFY